MSIWTEVVVVLWGGFHPSSGIMSGMHAQKIRRIIGIVILMVSLALLIWGLWPFGDLVRTVPIDPQDMQLPSNGGLLLDLIWGWI